MLVDCIDCTKSLEKMNGGLLVTADCRRVLDKDGIAYLIIPSFELENITPEDANKQGYKLGLEFIGDETRKTLVA